MNDFRKKIWNRLIFFLSQRDHTEKELQIKLQKKFPDHKSTLLECIEKAKELELLLPSQVLQERIAKSLSLKKKSSRFINQKLKAKGLNPLPEIQINELVKAKDILAKKWHSSLSKKEIQKLSGSLYRRGFSMSTIYQAIKELQKISSTDTTIETLHFEDQNDSLKNE